MEEAVGREFMHPHTSISYEGEGEDALYNSVHTLIRTTSCPRVLSTEDEMTAVSPVYAGDCLTSAAARSITTAFSGSDKSEKKRVRVAASWC